MRILVLAPHPYYIVRGTPIDLDLVLRVLSSRPNTEIDLVVYGEGRDRAYPSLTIHRTPVFRLTRTKGPGFSVQKLVSDAVLFAKATSLLRRQRYDLIHAGEEAVYMAMVFRKLFGVPYAYDLDSSLAEQMIEKMPWLRPLGRFFDYCERSAIRGAAVTFPVCNALADKCRDAGAREIVTLHDISQLRDPHRPKTGSLERELGMTGTVVLYAGNLEEYQGVDLLLEGFALAVRRLASVHLVIIGGAAPDIARYRAKADGLGIAARTHFLGPKPYEELDGYLAEADILAAPRIKGRNTPMKVFPYLHSGRAVLVTNLPTHTQVLTPDVAVLADPDPASFAEAIVSLASDPARREALGARGRAFVEANHTFRAYRDRLAAAYDALERQLVADR
jgi:glycosyltransferase involved in cell wall biosynthesis